MAGFKPAIVVRSKIRDIRFIFSKSLNGFQLLSAWANMNLLFSLGSTRYSRYADSKYICFEDDWFVSTLYGHMKTEFVLLNRFIVERTDSFYINASHGGNENISVLYKHLLNSANYHSIE